MTTNIYTRKGPIKTEKTEEEINRLMDEFEKELKLLCQKYSIDVSTEYDMRVLCYYEKNTMAYCREY